MVVDYADNAYIIFHMNDSSHYFWPRSLFFFFFFVLSVWWTTGTRIFDSFCISPSFDLLFSGREGVRYSVA